MNGLADTAMSFRRSSGFRSSQKRPLWTRSGARLESGEASPSLISPLEPPSIVGYTMESLEIIVVPAALIGTLLLGAIWTTVALHWLRSTEPLQ